MAGLVSSIKNDVKKAGTNKGKFIYFRPDQKQRVRFLQDMDDGVEIVFHDSFERSINVPCQEAVFGRNCPYCEDDGVRTRSQYAWCVYNYDAKEVQIFMFPVNNCSPIPSLMAMYETYGTLTDRDYVISVSGKGPDKSYSVVPMDKVKFRNEKAKPFSEKKILEMLDKAFPCTDDEDEEEDEAPRKPKAPKMKGKGKAKPEPEEEDDDWEDEEDDDEVIDYSEMSAKELYKLCKERKIDVLPKKPNKYYIKQLEDWDKAQDDWDDDEDDYDDDQDWEDEE